MMMMMLSKFATRSSNRAPLLMMQSTSRALSAVVAGSVIVQPPTTDSLSSTLTTRTSSCHRRANFFGNISNNYQRISSSSSSSSKRLLSFYQQQPGGGNTSGGYGGSGSGSGPLRAFPTYAVFGETCLLSVKLIPPLFRVQPNTNTIFLDSNKKGRILLEWTPRGANGKLSRDKESILRFGLSAEEVGLMLDQLPANIVEFSRRPTMPSTSGNWQQQQPSEFGITIPAEAAPNTNTTDVPDKVLRITPGDGGSMAFLVDHELNGVSVAAPTPASLTSATTPTTGPLVVVAQLGEFQVIRELLRTSIPILVGWSTMVEIAMQRNFENMQSNKNNNSNNRGGYGTGYGGGEFTF